MIRYLKIFEHFISQKKEKKEKKKKRKKRKERKKKSLWVRTWHMIL